MNVATHIMPKHSLDVGRPLSGDVVDLLIADHAMLERLLRLVRDSSSDREAARHALATVLVAHAEAEEMVVYPKLRRHSAVSAEEAEHGKDEHLEGHEALLRLLELQGTTAAFDEAIDELSNVVMHHVADEELSILNPARHELGDRARADLGTDFARMRNQLIDEDCGDLMFVKRLVKDSHANT